MTVAPIDPLTPDAAADPGPAVANLETIVSLSKRRGFIFPSSEIYGGINAVWDYGPLGVELKNNVKRSWWRAMVQERSDIVGLDAGILMAPQVWVTSGHVAEFSDPLVECATCKRRYRVDDLPGAEDLSPAEANEPVGHRTARAALPQRRRPAVAAASLQPDAQDVPRPGRGRGRHRLPAAGDRAGHLRQLQERPGVESQEAAVRHRPDRQEPFATRSAPATPSSGCGSSSRWRCSTSCVPTRRSSASRSGSRGDCAWYERFGVTPERLRFREHGPGELAHYAKKAIDVEYRFPFGWKELEGIHNRGDWDLGRHQEASGENLEYFDPATNEHYVPWIVETSAGADRASFTFLIDAYREEEVRGEKRVRLALHPELAPYKVAVLPLLKKRPEIVELCQRILADLKLDLMAVYDDTAAIGKLYRRQDEIGTPWCVTVDVDSLEDGAVTVRDRDSMAQERVPVEGVKRLILDRMAAARIRSRHRRRPSSVSVTNGPSGWRGLWTPQRARLWLIACAVAAYLPVVAMPLRGWLDFSAFYAAGSLAFTADVARLAPIVEFQQANGLPITPFVYPAGVALPYVAFAALPYGLAAALHVVLMAALLVLAARLGADLLGLSRRWVVLGALAWGPAAAGVVSGQNTSFALLMVVVVGLGFVRKRDALAGLAAAVLTYKPQLGAPIAGMALLRGRWLVVAMSVTAIGVHYVLGVVATGGNLAWPRDWLDTLQAYSGADLVENGWQAVSLPGIGARLELLTGIPGLTILGYALGALVVVLSLRALRDWPPVEAIALACACGLVISPHAWVYDAALLLPAVGVLARRATDRGWPWRDRWLLAGAYALAVTWPLGGFVGFTLVLPLVIAAPFVLLRTRPGTATHAAV